MRGPIQHNGQDYFIELPRDVLEPAGFHIGDALSAAVEKENVLVLKRITTEGTPGTDENHDLKNA
jgi:antitoxin component of MazEF toxin-antitoxin module